MRDEKKPMGVFGSKFREVVTLVELHNVRVQMTHDGDHIDHWKLPHTCQFRAAIMGDLYVVRVVEVNHL